MEIQKLEYIIYVNSSNILYTLIVLILIAYSINLKINEAFLNTEIRNLHFIREDREAKINRFETLHASMIENIDFFSKNPLVHRIYSSAKIGTKIIAIYKSTDDFQKLLSLKRVINLVVNNFSIKSIDAISDIKTGTNQIESLRHYYTGAAVLDGVITPAIVVFGSNNAILQAYTFNGSEDKETLYFIVNIIESIVKQ